MIPILTIRLLDIPIPDSHRAKKLFLGGAKDLLREHPQQLTERGIDIDLFHNKDVKYSGIQLSRWQGAPEWTAVGAASVAALRLWYELFCKQSPMPLKNTVEIREQYSPEFMPKLHRYHAPALLISDDLAKQLNNIDDAYLRNDKLERYLYGNIQTFLAHIGYTYEPNTHYLKVTLHDFQYARNPKPIFHDNIKTACNLHFSTNFRLPQTLRLGQATGIGYGRVWHGRYE